MCVSVCLSVCLSVCVFLMIIINTSPVCWKFPWNDVYQLCYLSDDYCLSIVKLHTNLLHNNSTSRSFGMNIRHMWCCAATTRFQIDIHFLKNANSG